MCVRVCVTYEYLPTNLQTYIHTLHMARPNTHTYSRPPEIDPLRDLKLNDLDFSDKFAKKNQLARRMTDSKCQACPKLAEQVCVYVCVVLM